MLQLEKILFEAGSNPQTVADIVKAKIKADTRQTELLFGYQYKINGKPVSANEIDGILNDSENLEQRLLAWRASKEVGKGLKNGLDNLRNLKNQSVQALGYADYFGYQVSDYGMTSDEMMQLCRQLVNDVWPLYRELHTWARYTLADKYKQEVPEMLPAHWLPNRWGQDWVGLVDVEGFDLDTKLEERVPSGFWIKVKNFISVLDLITYPNLFMNVLVYILHPQMLRIEKIITLRPGTWITS